MCTEYSCLGMITDWNMDERRRTIEQKREAEFLDSSGNKSSEGIRSLIKVGVGKPEHISIAF